MMRVQRAGRRQTFHAAASMRTYGDKSKQSVPSNRKGKSPEADRNDTETQSSGAHNLEKVGFSWGPLGMLSSYLTCLVLKDLPQAIVAASKSRGGGRFVICLNHALCVPVQVYYDSSHDDSEVSLDWCPSARPLPRSDRRSRPMHMAKAPPPVPPVPPPRDAMRCTLMIERGGQQPRC